MAKVPSRYLGPVCVVEGPRLTFQMKHTAAIYSKYKHSTITGMKPSNEYLALEAKLLAQVHLPDHFPNPRFARIEDLAPCAPCLP